LNQPFITVNGTLNTSGYAVWVNGVKATVDGNEWTAERVPMPEGGTAIIQARAIPLSDNEGNGTGGSGGEVATAENPGNPNSAQASDTETDVDKPMEIVMTQYSLGRTDSVYMRSDVSPWYAKEWADIGWARGQPGSWTWAECYGTPMDEYYLWDESEWGEKGTGTGRAGMRRGAGICGIKSTETESPYEVYPGWPGEFCTVSPQREEFDGFETYDRYRVRIAKTYYELRTGGKAKPRRMNLFVLTGEAIGVADPFWPEVDWWWPSPYSIAPTSVVLGSLGSLGSDGRLYKALPDGASYDVTPTVAGNPYYGRPQPQATKHKLLISANGATLLPDKTVTTNCVGQKVTFSSGWESQAPYSGTPPGIRSNNWDWVTSAKFVNHRWQHSLFDEFGNEEFYGSWNYDIDQNLLRTAAPWAWWVSGGEKNATLNRTVYFDNGQSVKLRERGRFSIFRPTVVKVPADTVPSFFPGYIGAVPGLKLGGDGDPREGHHEMLYDVDFQTGGYTGTGGVLQLLTANYSARPSLTFSDWRLDGNSELYVSGPIDPTHYPAPQTSVTFDDEPSNHQPFIFSTIWVQASFRDYCVFKPDAGPGENIFVTLGLVTWSCDGEVSQIHIGEPGFPGIKLTKDIVVGPDGPIETDEFPHWDLVCSEGSRGE
jgi:hypothetical protein